MDQNLGQHKSSYSKANIKIPIKETRNKEKSKKCDQCDFASSWASSFKLHLKTHSGEKSNKCNQCDYASSEAGNLRRHSEIHSNN